MQRENTEVAESIYLITSFLTIGIKMKTWIYPISIPFTEDILELLWNFLLVITNNDKRSSINTLILEDVSDRCRSFVFGGETVMRLFLRKILRELKGEICICYNFVSYISYLKRRLILEDLFGRFFMIHVGV